MHMHTNWSCERSLYTASLFFIWFGRKGSKLERSTNKYRFYMLSLRTCFICPHSCCNSQGILFVVIGTLASNLTRLILTHGPGNLIATFYYLICEAESSWRLWFFSVSLSSSLVLMLNFFHQYLFSLLHLSFLSLGYSYHTI